jgi:hypothetical protein
MTRPNTSEPGTPEQTTASLSSNDAKKSFLASLRAGGWVPTSGQVQDTWKDLRTQAANVDQLQSERQQYEATGSRDTDANKDLHRLERNFEMSVLTLDQSLNRLGQLFQLPDSAQCGGQDSAAFSQLRNGIEAHPAVCSRSDMREWSILQGSRDLSEVLSKPYQ